MFWLQLCYLASIAFYGIWSKGSVKLQLCTASCHFRVPLVKRLPWVNPLKLSPVFYLILLKGQCTCHVVQDVPFTLLDTWGEFPAPGIMRSLCLAEQTLWCTDQACNLYYTSLTESSLQWKQVEKAPASQIAASPSGWIVWRLHKGSIYVGTKLTTNRVSPSTKWMEVAKDVAYISVDETYSW